MSTELHSDWIKQITPLIFEQDEIPMLGPIAPFPWEELSQGLSERLHYPISIKAKECVWRATEEISEGAGENPYSLFFSINPLEGQLVWIISQEELWKLFGAICQTDISSADLRQESLQEGFLHFIALEALDALESFDLMKGLSPQLAASQDLSKAPFLCLDIAVELNERAFWSRLCLSGEFRRSYKKHREGISTEAFLSSAASKVEITLGIEIGQTEFTFLEWSSIHPGDWLVIEKSNYDPEELKGVVHLTFNEKKLLRGRLRADHIKLHDLPLHFEEISHMERDDQTPPEEHEEEFSLFEEGENEEDLLSEEELMAALAEEGMDTLPPKEEAESEQQAPEPVVEKKEEEVKEQITPSEIPLTISIEIGRLRLTVKELLELQAGNQLSLDKEVDNTVSLISGGKCIGKGELIRIGDLLGVRITQL